MTWLTNTGISSGRLYWENKLGFFDVKGVSVPAAVTVFPRELYQAPRSWTEKAYPKLIYFNEVDRGNHFAAWQRAPALLRGAAQSLPIAPRGPLIRTRTMPAAPSRPRLLGAIAHRLAGDATDLPVEGRLPSFEGATGWLNSPPLTPEGLRGRVVLVDFWTYTCVNWLRTLPYVRAWAAKYAGQGLTIVGAHTPEFGFEHDVDNVIAQARALRRRLPDRHRQRLRRLAGVRQPLLAGDLPRRRRGTDPVPPLRRGRVRHDRDGDPAAAAGCRCRRHRSGSRVGRSAGPRGGGRLPEPALARDVPRIRPGERVRLARWRAGGPSRTTTPRPRD